MEITSATCCDPAHPPSAIVDGSSSTFWATTGLFPHEVVMRLPAKASLARLRLRCANVKHIIVERCDGASAVAWSSYVEAELPDVEGVQEIVIPTPGFPVSFLKLRIASAFTEHACVFAFEADSR